MSTIRAGLIGLGRFGRLHASILDSLAQVELAAVCDIVPDRVEAVAARYGVPDAYAQPADLLSDPALDCVFIATDEEHHARLALSAVEAKKHVFVEKPLAKSYADGKRVVDAADAAGVYLQVGYILRFEARHALLKGQIQRGEFGDLATIRCKRNPSKAWFLAYGHKRHPVFRTSTHDIDLCLWYTQSECERVYAAHRSMLGLENPDTCVALLQFANGTVGFIETSWLVPAGAPATVGQNWGQVGAIDASLDIVGTEQTAHLEFAGPTFSVWTPQMTHYPELTAWPPLHGETVGALRAEVAHFVDCVLEGTLSGIASAEDAVAGLKIAEAVVTSANAKQEIQLLT